MCSVLGKLSAGLLSPVWVLKLQFLDADPQTRTTKSLPGWISPSWTHISHSSINCDSVVTPLLGQGEKYSALTTLPKSDFLVAAHCWRNTPPPNNGRLSVPSHHLSVAVKPDLYSTSLVLLVNLHSISEPRTGSAVVFFPLQQLLSTKTPFAQIHAIKQGRRCGGVTAHALALGVECVFHVLDPRYILILTGLKGGFFQFVSSRILLLRQYTSPVSSPVQCFLYCKLLLLRHICTHLAYLENLPRSTLVRSASLFISHHDLLNLFHISLLTYG